ncbi:MAG: terminase large subunit [Carboxydocellales bacterium]
MAADSKYSKDAADYAVAFIEALCHTKGSWAGKPFELIDWQEQIVRDVFGILKPNGYRQFNTAYVEIPKKMGKSELAAAIALLLTCGDNEERAEVYGCTADRQQASIVFEVAADMVRMCPALSLRVKLLASTKRLVYLPTNSFYQVLSAEAYSKHGFNIHGVVFDELHTQSNRKLFAGHDERLWRREDAAAVLSHHHGGLDLSSTTDITAFVLVFPPEDEDGKYQILPFFWMPEENIDLRIRRDHVQYDLWERQGCLMTTGGEKYNIRAIRNENKTSVYDERGILVL